MSKDKSDEFGGEAPTAALAEIPVKMLKFRNGITVDLPGKPTASGLVSSEPKNQAFYRIAYLPRIRMHRVEFYAPGPKKDRKPADVVFVPEGWATWSPL